MIASIWRMVSFDFLIPDEFAALDLLIGLGEIGTFLGRQPDDGPVSLGKLQERAGKVVLYVGG